MRLLESPPHTNVCHDSVNIRRDSGNIRRDSGNFRRGVIAPALFPSSYICCPSVDVQASCRFVMDNHFFCDFQVCTCHVIAVSALTKLRWYDW